MVIQFNMLRIENEQKKIIKIRIKQNKKEMIINLNIVKNYT